MATAVPRLQFKLTALQDKPAVLLPQTAFTQESHPGVSYAIEEQVDEGGDRDASRIVSSTDAADFSASGYQGHLPHRVGSPDARVDRHGRRTRTVH